MPNSPAIEVCHLTKRYATGHTAVADLSLTIDRGETVALLGPNGAGKSTTVEILEGFRSPTSGEVRVLGTDPARPTREHKARVGIVLQSSAESPNVTVAEQLTHFGRLYPRSRSVEELLTATGLEAQRNTRVSRLSGGQRRRVDVALGVIGRPEVLFLDEPTTGFDPEARRQFWDLVDGIKREGTTVLSTAPDIRILILTTYESDDQILAAIEAGATGYLLKAAPESEILAGVRATARGETALAPSAAAALVRRTIGTTPTGPSLTPRELDVLRLVAQGNSNPAIGRVLFLSETTVKTHLGHVFEKLGVNDRTRAVTCAMELGLLP